MIVILETVVILEEIRYVRRSSNHSGLQITKNLEQQQQLLQNNETIFAQVEEGIEEGKRER